MRLSPQASEAIVRSTAELASARARVLLFGLHLHDHLHGGDTDRRVQCPQLVARPVWLAAQINPDCSAPWANAKIDVLLVDPTTVLEPVHRVAQAEGVKLTLDLPGH